MGCSYHTGRFPDMSTNKPFSPLHGGNLIAASEQYDIPLSDWIDLSTGINPEPYPIPSLDTSVYQQLPYELPEFLQASAAYYGSTDFVAVSGTQAAIQVLPGVLPELPILIPEIGYQEHAKHWSKAGTTITRYPSQNPAQTIRFIDQQLLENTSQHLLIINPNNPTGVLFEQNQLIGWAETLGKGAYLIVDEAFMDLTPEYSLLALGGFQQPLPANVIVLRSFGKFFGLAGIRLGYIFAQPDLLAQFENVLGLWQVNGPAQHIAIAALTDLGWQHNNQRQLQRNAEFTRNLFSPLFQKVPHQLLAESLLFTSYLVELEQAVAISRSFAESGVLLRVIDHSDSKAIVRVGVLSQNYNAASSRIEALVAAF